VTTDGSEDTMTGSANDGSLGAESGTGAVPTEGWASEVGASATVTETVGRE